MWRWNNLNGLKLLFDMLCACVCVWNRKVKIIHKGIIVTLVSLLWRWLLQCIGVHMKTCVQIYNQSVKANKQNCMDLCHNVHSFFSFLLFFSKRREITRSFFCHCDKWWTSQLLHCSSVLFKYDHFVKVNCIRFFCVDWTKLKAHVYYRNNFSVNYTSRVG